MKGKKKPISRRDFTKVTTIGAALAGTSSAMGSLAGESKVAPLRLGGPVFEKYEDPETWVRALKKLGYRAAYCPVGPEEKDDVVNAYARAAEKADIVIAEVGAWSNPVSPDEETRTQSLVKCRTHLALADRIGARCCVSTSGSRNKIRGPHPDNLTMETFDLIVETMRKIIDDVKPTRSFYALETMPWIYPDSPDSYLQLIKAIDRKQFAAHLDPVNLVCSPQRYFNNGALIRECFNKLGPYIKSCHAKDTLIQPELTTHIDEVRPGLGKLDYATYLRELSRRPDTPLMLEHLETAEEYGQGAEYIRSVAGGIGLSFG
ncbi:sugar phosphate isomerase/epimerase family protein [Gemmatimonadota bacterium]